MEDTGSAAMAELQVRATTMSGRQVDLLLGAEEPIALLRQKVSEALGIRKWQLRLIHGGMVVNNGGLIKELVEQRPKRWNSLRWRLKPLT